MHMAFFAITQIMSFARYIQRPVLVSVQHYCVTLHGRMEHAQRRQQPYKAVVTVSYG